MTEQSPPNQAQAAIWNEVGGHAWADLQATLDQVLQPLGTLLTDVAVAAGGRRVLDVGCGAGGTTLWLARALGSKCTGIDISAPLIAAANARAAAEGATDVTFIRADAQTYDFEPGSFDLVISRLGVMFFDDPDAAFANLRRAARPQAQLAFLAWRSREENPFMTTADRVAAPIVQELATRRHDGPGQFAFAAKERVQSILRASGWTSIALRPVDIACTMPDAKLPLYATRMGPYGLIRDTLDATVRARADSAILAAFDPYVAGDEVRFISACWLATAVA